MKKALTFTVLFFILSSSFFTPAVYADKIEQGFKALSVYDYYKAYHSFKDEFRSDTVSKKLTGNYVASTYGLSRVTSQSDNHFYNLDSAYYYVLLSKAAYFSLNAEQRQKLDVKMKKLESTMKKDKQNSSFFMLHSSFLEIDSFSILNLQDTIEQEAFRTLISYPFKLNPTIEGYNHYISTYRRDGMHAVSTTIAKVIELRNALAFDITQKENTYQAYKTFMEVYPDSKEVDKAKKMYELLLFKSLTEPHTVQCYAGFITRYPLSPFEGVAEDSLYRLSTNTGDLDTIHNSQSPSEPARADIIQRYYDFIKHYGSNKNVPAAWRKIYSVYTMDGKPETFRHFRQTYPDYPFSQHADSDLILSRTIFYPAKKGTQWGYIDSSGVLRIPYQFEWADTAFFNGLAAVAQNDKLGFINKRGELVIPCIYEEADHFHRTIAIVKKTPSSPNGGGGYGIISSIGRVLVPFEYQEILDFAEERGQVEKNNLFGFINLLGEEVIPARYSDATDFSEGLASVENADNKYGYINRDGKVIIPFSYEWADKFRDSVAKVKANGKFGLIDIKGNLLLPFIYDNIGDFSDSLAMVVQGLKIGYCNKKGSIVIPLKYDFSLDLLNSGNFLPLTPSGGQGVAKVQLKKKRGFISKDGKLVIPCKYDDALYFSLGLAPVMENSKWGYINETGKLVIPFKYKQAFAFSDSLAKVEVDSLYGYIDLKGAMRIPPQYNAASDMILSGQWAAGSGQSPNPTSGETKGSFSLALVQINKKYGLIDKEGNFIAPCVWTDIKFIQNGLLKVSINDKMAYYSLKTHRYIWQEEGFGR